MTIGHLLTSSATGYPSIRRDIYDAIINGDDNTFGMGMWQLIDIAQVNQKKHTKQIDNKQFAQNAGKPAVKVAANKGNVNYAKFANHGSKNKTLKIANARQGYNNKQFAFSRQWQSQRGA
jgi:hypothetical protein